MIEILEQSTVSSEVLRMHQCGSLLIKIEMLAPAWEVNTWLCDEYSHCMVADGEFRRMAMKLYERAETVREERLFLEE